MKMFFWISLFSLALCSSCQKSSPPNQKQVLHVNILAEPQSLDPRKTRLLSDISVMHMLFEGLTRIGKESVAELALGDSFEVSEEGHRYVFHLREAAWSNGAPVTSHDFAYSWKKMLDPLFPSEVAYQLFPIKGAKAAKSGEGSLDQVGIETPDDQTLIVMLEQPIPYFLELLTFPSFFPVNQQLDRENPQWAEDPSTYVCNGPFVLSKWEHGEELELTRNVSYWDVKNVHLQGLDLIMVNEETELRLFRDGKLDWAGSPLSNVPTDAMKDLKERGSLQVKPFSGTYLLRVNTKDDSPLSDPLFRKSLALAIDREQIAEHILQGGQLPARALVPPIVGLSSNGYFQDVGAKESLSLYLQKVGKKVEELPPITLLYQAGDRNHGVALAVREQIGQLGISILLQPVERKTLYERLAKKQYQLAAGSWIADFNDPINFLEVFKYKESGTNNTGWENQKYIERLDLSNLCRDRESRMELLREAEEILMQEMPFIPIYHFALNYLEREGVRDVCLSPIGQIDFRWSHVE
jgi:oligopeptide transport system substrate-binding protein